jgi:hypothetical protein
VGRRWGWERVGGEGRVVVAEWVMGEEGKGGMRMPEVVKVGIGCIFQPAGFDSIDGHDVGRGA